eukprot:gnl/TRDRNA2_/TRDRNA2_91149_c0_seq1.p1 gnl/TRDRNA2_/TRDRNA2_91149_c0~~gnl/TRDRNA2_/TRDRNA2_91149_c0_seq1.p1  ORF type:complete len:238 (+),score=41.37 gnl/TRDRNA2_/TRDRNA2_91149_c0_seq1:110-823(+)
MPETGVGFFPDVGASWWLSRVKAAGVGLLVALSGMRLNASDLIYTGLATHYVPSTHISKLEAALHSAAAESTSAADAAAAAMRVLASYATEPDASLSTLRKEAKPIEECFALPTTIDGIRDALSRHADHGSTWAAETLSELEKKSPTSLKITHEALRRGATMELDDVLRMDFRLAMCCCRMLQSAPRDGDFYEGTRAVLIDKTGQPKWKPTDLQGISSELISLMFAEIGDRELRLGV